MDTKKAALYLNDGGLDGLVVVDTYGGCGTEGGGTPAAGGSIVDDAMCPFDQERETSGMAGAALG